MQKYLFLQNIASINAEEFKDQRVVVKGCGEVQIDNYAYSEITRLLLPHVKTVMYGEPCSTVPIYKKSKKTLCLHFNHRIFYWLSS